MDKKEFLGTAPIGKLLFKLSVPTLVAQLINMLYNVVDRIYIGHIPEVGSLALTGVGVCLPILLIVSAFASLVSAGGAPRASIFMGKQQMENAEKTLGGCFALQILVSFVLTILLLIFGESLLLAFGASENTISYAVDYLWIYSLGTIFVQMTLGMNAFITAQGFTKISMLSVAIGGACNILLDPIFIFLLRMGVSGAALATVISQAVSCVWVIRFLSGKKTFLRLKREYLKIDPKVVLPCVALGTATFIMQASESVISVCFNSSLLKYGGDLAVGAMTILTSVMGFAMMPLQGLGQGAQPISSYNYGAGNADRVKKTFRVLLICSLSYSVVLWIAVQFAPQVFVGIFSPDPTFVAFAAKALKTYLGGIFLFGIQIACQMTFTSLGKAASSIIVAVVRKFVLLIPLIYIMPHLVENPTMGVYMAEPVADVIAVTFTTILFSVQFRKAMNQIVQSND